MSDRPSPEFPCGAWGHEESQPCPSCVSVGYCQGAVIPPGNGDTDE